MPWTRDEKLRYLRRLPWTVTLQNDEEQEYIAQIAELPFVVATGATIKAVGRELYAALTMALDAMLEHGDKIVLPPRTTAPWEHGEEPPRGPILNVLRAPLTGEAWEPRALAVAESLAVSL